MKKKEYPRLSDMARLSFAKEVAIINKLLQETKEAEKTHDEEQTSETLSRFLSLDFSLEVAYEILRDKLIDTDEYSAIAAAKMHRLEL